MVSQKTFFAKASKSYGGQLFRTRTGRATGRPISTRNSMHVVLKSSKAKGQWSFRNTKNKRKINEIVEKHATRFGVKIYSLANVGNHLHFHLIARNRFAFKNFLRAITGAIAMAVTGVNRWNPLPEGEKLKFWDYRPFSRIISGFKDFLNIQDYIQLNKYEGDTRCRATAHILIDYDKGLIPDTC